MEKGKKPLTPNEKQRIRKVIATRTACDDRPTEEIIRKDFHGDEDAYLRAMAKYYGIQLDTS